ncbi:hypothetical protein KC323_g8124 [Hortaea werneckii]|nr:hypothetical protein KC323_g8124 [Hortaea werneckii]
MVYLECLAAFILDQSIDSLRHLRRFGATAGRQRIHPNPWTGVSTPLFVHLAETAILMRCKRTCSTYHSTRPQRDSSVDLWDTINQTAKDLYERILKYRPPSANMVDDTKDPNTPVDHLISVDIIHRFVILMELVQAFPGLSMGSNWETSNETAIATQASELAFDCAVAILNIVSQLPENSGANIMLSIPLIAAGSALQTRQRPESPQSPETPHGIRDSTFAVMRGRAMVEIWREQTQSRLERTYRRVGVAPLLRASQLLQQVWQRADSVTREDERDKSPFSVHWMSIMTAESLETLFG